MIIITISRTSNTHTSTTPNIFSNLSFSFIYQESPDYLRGLIKKTRTLTDKPFGVGIVLAFPYEENLKVILDEKVAVLQTYWGDCTTELVTKAHSAGVKVVPQVSFICYYLCKSSMML